MPDVLRPLFDQVVIKELEPDRMRKSGLLVPQGSNDLPPNEGIVLAAGDGPPDLPDFKMPVKPGDHVVFPRSAGVWVEVEDERLLVCRVRELRKLAGVVGTGGEAKHLLASEEVRVNGEPETRRGRQLHAGDEVLVGDEGLRVA